jgi:NADH:ubiquinone oxidoreductase subunit K
MPVSGRRHRLILYTYILDHLWRKILGIGIILLALVEGIIWLPSVLPQYPPLQVAFWILTLAAGAAMFAICLAIFLVIIRKSAYVQPFDDHLRLVTPFLRMKISYQRLVQTSSAELGQLFPLKKLKGRNRDLMRPWAKQTAIVLELKGWPLPRWALNLFYSPFFFPDRTSRLALLVPDWIDFSTELESFRSAWFDSLHRPARSAQSDLLASLSENR